MQQRCCKYYKQREHQMNRNIDAVICVFCMTVIADKIDYTQTQYCVDCNEYKGITTIREYEAEYGETVVMSS
jgi:hypothetical protein